MADEKPLAKHVKHDNRARFTIVAHVFEYHVDYVVYDITSFEDGEIDRPVRAKANPEQNSDRVFFSQNSDLDTALAQAEIYLHGSVKWDGCSNWHFDEQDRLLLHGCDREDLQRLGDVMAHCWDWTEELCPSWCV